MSRPRRPIDADKATIAVMMLVVARANRPCPTRDEIVECTGLQRREVWPFIEQLQERGLVELEQRGEGTRNVWRRMRVINGAWTDWTERRPPATEVQELPETART